jgi:hypothetical protein
MTGLELSFSILLLFGLSFYALLCVLLGASLGLYCLVLGWDGRWGFLKKNLLQKNNVATDNPEYKISWEKVIPKIY